MSAAALYLLGGFLVILAAWIPLFLRGAAISLPMIALAIGLLLSLGIGYEPLRAYSASSERVAEFALLVAVLGAGLRIDRPFSLRAWASTWRLLGIVMPLSIAAAAAAAHALIGLPLGYAIVIGAVLSPTDPVLAAGVQAGPPGVGEEGEPKFALTTEAGLNDGLAFPFVMLGLGVAGQHIRSPSDLLNWFGIAFVWNIAAGVGAGVAIGAGLVFVNRWLPKGWRLPDSNSGIVAIGLAFVAYGAANAIGGNGFVAVFSEAVAIRNLATSYEYSRHLSRVAEQFERVAMVLILVILGTGMAQGLLSDIGWDEIGFTILLFAAIRPATIALGFFGSSCDYKTKIGLGYFGIRGIASVYYASYLLNQVSADAAVELTRIVALVVLVSVALYGATTDYVAKHVLGHAPEEGPVKN